LISYKEQDPIHQPPEGGLASRTSIARNGRRASFGALFE
jgi:hypothetical protein